MTDDYATAASQVIDATELEFGRAQPKRPISFIWGEWPQHIVWQDRSEIYLKRVAFGDFPRFLFQVSHEAFHDVCTPAGTFPWSHEMLAVLWSLKYLRQTSHYAYARRALDDERARINECSIPQMLAIDKANYPPGFYARAEAVGVELERIVGWLQLRLLARSFDAAGCADFDAWRDALPSNHATAVNELLAA